MKTQHSSRVVSEKPRVITLIRNNFIPLVEAKIYNGGKNLNSCAFLLWVLKYNAWQRYLRE